MLCVSQGLESDIINSRKEGRKIEIKGYQTDGAKRKQTVKSWGVHQLALDVSRRNTAQKQSKYSLV